jgi:hypothetical protein
MSDIAERLAQAEAERESLARDYWALRKEKEANARICQNCIWYRAPNPSAGSFRCTRRAPTGDYEWPRVGWMDSCGEFERKLPE